jgi:hypothetical protein
MKPEQWMMMVVLGGLMGMLGQGIRATVGIKKLYDKSAGDNSLVDAGFSAIRFILSLFIGFIAGALTALMLSDGQTETAASKEYMGALMTAGYAGADTIEGLANKMLPNRTQGMTRAS